MSTTEPVTPALAPLDDLGREIQAVLELVSPRNGYEPDPVYGGYSDAAAEAYFHLARAREPGRALRVVKHGTGRSAHYWLTGEDGRIIDLTLTPADRRARKDDPSLAYPYERGRGSMFRTGASTPSKRAAAVMELVTSRAG